MFESVQATHGIAVAPHHLAAQSAESVLREGGSAIEAMVAAAATIAVVYPHMNSIGGDGFWLIVPPQGNPITIDASGPAGSGATLQRYEAYQQIPFRGVDAALTVPGTVDGWRTALELSAALHQGTPIALSRLLAEAIDYARNGVAVTHSQSSATQEKHAELMGIHGFADVFLPSEGVPGYNVLLKQPALAATLEHLAHAGLDDFYRGDIAASISSEINGLGMPVSAEDLARYHARTGSPLTLQHHVGEIFNLAPPTQGLVSLMILGIADRLGIQNVAPESADYIHILVEATKRAFVLRDRYITDPSRIGIDVQTLLEDAILQRESDAIDPFRAAPWGSDKGPGDTVWLGAIDRNGLAVSFIQSIYHEFGSGVVLRDTGITWQNRGASFSLQPGHVNILAPGKQPFHTLNPAAARFNDGRTMVYGSMGGDGQPQTQAALFTRYALFNEQLQRAITAPRWLLGRTWGNSSMSLKLEERISPEVSEELRHRGHTIERLKAFDEAVGHAGAIVRHPNGVLEGAFDPRSNGAAAGY